MKFVHTADLHLGRFYRGELPYEIAEKRREELWVNFENTVKYCKDNNIDLLFISGDLYEKEYFTLFDINRLKDILNTLSYTKVFIIAGNHDYISESSLYNNTDFNENIYIFKKEKYFDIDDLKLRVHGISWNNDIEFSEELNFNMHNEYKNILLLHGSVNSDSYFPVKKEDLSKLKFDYIALGHIHIPQKILDNSYYPGSPEGLNFKETGEHGFIIGEMNKELKINFINKSIRKYNTIEIELKPQMTFNEIKTFLYEILKDNKNDLNRIILKGQYDNGEALISAIRFNEEYFYVELVNEIEEILDIKSIYENNKKNIIGKFIDDMKDNNEALIIGLKALLEAKNEN